jgi:uncharacterized SAM-binding protein YcdF (DUF218 family)
MKRLIRIVLAIAGTVLSAQAIILSAYMSFNAGIIASLAIGLACIVYSVLFNPIQAMTQKGILKWLKYGGFFIILLLVGMMIFIAYYGQTDTVTYNEDAVIILGAGIDGETPRYPLLHRLEQGAEYYQKNPDAVIVVSGGKGNDEDITEALAMERYLVAHGVPKSHIFKEEESTSTYENFVFSRKILDQHFIGPYSTLIITSDFHVFRATQIAKIAGLNGTTLHAGIIWYSILVIYIREAMALVQFIVFRQ